jgi:hypothetical protein
MSLEGLAAVVAIVTGVGMFKREHLRNWFTFGRFVLSVEVVAVSVWAVVLQVTRITDISRYTLADLSRSVCVAGISARFRTGAKWHGRKRSVIGNQRVTRTCDPARGSTYIKLL